MTEAEQEALIEAVAGAYRARDPRSGVVLPHPAHGDLSPGDRAAAFEAAVLNRRLEAAFDPEGRSTTVRAVLARITKAAVEE